MWTTLSPPETAHPPQTAGTAMTATRALRPSTRGSKVWWSSSRAMDELYDTWTLEPSWHASQRQLQLDLMRTKRRQTHEAMLGRLELFSVNKLKAQREAEAVQRACDEAQREEIVFLPKLPAARKIAEVHAQPRSRY